MPRKVVTSGEDGWSREREYKPELTDTDPHKATLSWFLRVVDQHSLTCADTASVLHRFPSHLLRMKNQDPLTATKIMNEEKKPEKTEL